MEKRTEKTILKVTLGFLVVLLLGMSTLLVTAVSTGKNPVDILFLVDKEQAVVIAQNYAQGTVEEVEVATADNPVHEVEIQDGEKETEEEMGIMEKIFAGMFRRKEVDEEELK